MTERSMAEEIAIRLVVEEEIDRQQSGGSNSFSPAPAPTQKPTMENITGVLGSGKYTLKSDNNVVVPTDGQFLNINTSGGGKQIHIRKIFFSTVTEWTDLKISIDTKIYQAGDFALMEELGYAWYDPQDELYNFNILGSNVDFQLTMSIDPGITLTSLVQDYYIA